MSEVDAGISFSVPWLNYNKYSAEIHEAERRTSVRRNWTLQRAQSEAVGALRDALEKVETMHHHIELLQDKIVPQAKQALEASQLGYESGKASFLDWTTAQRNLRESPNPCSGSPWAITRWPLPNSRQSSEAT